MGILIGQNSLIYSLIYCAFLTDQLANLQLILGVLLSGTLVETYFTLNHVVKWLFNDIDYKAMKDFRAQILYHGRTQLIKRLTLISPGHVIPAKAHRRQFKPERVIPAKAGITNCTGKWIQPSLMTDFSHFKILSCVEEFLQFRQLLVPLVQTGLSFFDTLRLESGKDLHRECRTEWLQRGAHLFVGFAGLRSI